ncbi:MAG TPA: YncE family protein [Streptosporangiaceae bacterium]|nr:YncE family protein [Streptosporangiaceae bacterium]
MSPSRGTARRALCGAILGSVLLLLGACSNSGSSSGGSVAASGSPSAAQPRTVAIGANPQAAALDPATHTLYADDAPENFTDGEVSVINASTCNARQASGCGVNTPEVQVGYRPGTIAVDQVTDTIYVVNSADNTVSVINGATCNALNTSGCSHRPPTVKVGSNPVDVSLDQATDTVYVANWGNGTGTTVSVIDGRTCNGQVTSGCGQIPATVTIGTAPAGVVVDEPADTVYAATVAPSGAEAVWVIDGATCNATTTSGCGQKPASVTVGAGSADYNVAFAIDQATQTLYVANWKNNTLSVIDTATCNATTTSGCARTPHAARAGSGPDGIALNLATDTLYVADITGDTVWVRDAATCNATVSSGCGTQHPRSLRTGQSPEAITVDQATDTLYVPNGDAGDMSVLNGATCNATVTSGCT